MIINEIPEDIWLELTLTRENSRWLRTSRFFLWVNPVLEMVSECILIDGKYYAQCVMKEKWIYEKPAFVFRDTTLWLDEEVERLFVNSINPIELGVDNYGKPYLYEIK